MHSLKLAAQAKKMKGVTLLKSLVSLTLQQFFSSCVAMDDLHMCRAVEQEQFNAWCTAAGIATASGLVIYFTSYAGALREAGRAVADGLDLARWGGEPGMAALVGRGLFACETVCQSRPAQPSSAAVLPTSSSTSVARPTLTSFAGPVRPKCVPDEHPSGARRGVASLFLRDLLGIMVTLMPPPLAREQEYLTNSGLCLGGFA